MGQPELEPVPMRDAIVAGRRLAYVRTPAPGTVINEAVPLEPNKFISPQGRSCRGRQFLWEVIPANSRREVGWLGWGILRCWPTPSIPTAGEFLLEASYAQMEWALAT